MHKNSKDEARVKGRGKMEVASSSINVNGISAKAKKCTFSYSIYYVLVHLDYCSSIMYMIIITVLSILQ